MENSLIHYLTVCLASVVFAVPVSLLWNRRRAAGPRSSEGIPHTGRAWIEVDLDHLTHNVKALQEIMPQTCEMMAVVKASAYGHGDFEIATHLNRIGVKAFAVATLDEGIRLRKYGVTGEILILGYTEPSRAKELRKYDLMQTLIDFAYADALNRQGVPVKAHVKIDTGMHRLGLPAEETGLVRTIFEMEHLQVQGIYTHLCCADSLQDEDQAFTRGQISRFYCLMDDLKDCGIAIPKIHIQSSYGLLNDPELSCDYARIGIALYGVLSTPDHNIRCRPDLRPVLSLKARVVLIRTVEAGETVGYGRSFTAERDTRLAILAIGYADGFPRSLSGGKAAAVIRRQTAPIVGRICMDQLAVDITDAEGIAVGDIATLIGAEADDRCTAPVVAEQADTISNELLSRMGSRLPVVVKRRR